VPIIETRGPIEAWIVDDTGFPKKGKHSVGVARQYCGLLGKQDNCQVAVSLSVASAEASLALGLRFAARRPAGNPRVAYRLSLPKAWAEEPARRAKAGVPEAIAFATQPMIALAQIEAALAADVPRGVVLADAGGACPRAGQGPGPWGADMKLQAGLLERELAYVVGVQPQAKIWIDGKEPLPAKPWPGRGRPPTNLRRAPDHQPVAAKAWASGLPHAAWQDVTWREGTQGELGSRFAGRLRARPAAALRSGLKPARRRLGAGSGGTRLRRPCPAPLLADAPVAGDDPARVRARSVLPGPRSVLGRARPGVRRHHLGRRRSRR
jgi:SRSO17 transposase